MFSTPIFFLLMPFFSKRVIHSSVFAKERSAVLKFELQTVDFTFARYRSKITELDFRFRHWYATVQIQRVTWWQVSSLVSFLLSALRASYGKLRFPESSPFGRRPFERIGFQPTRNTIACLQFDHALITHSDLNQQQMTLTGNTVK